VQSLIGPQDHWAVWTVLCGAAAFGLWAERTRWGSRLSGAVIAIATTLVLSNLGVLPSDPDTPAYALTWSYLVPLAIPLLLFAADLRRILREAGPTLVAFVAGAAGTVLGTVVAFHVVPLGEEGWKLAGIFCATYVGGSMNFVAVSKALALESRDLLTAGFAADNLVMAVYFIVLFALPSWGWLRRTIGERRVPAAGEDEREGPVETSASGRADVLTLTAGLALAVAVCAAGFWCEWVSDLAGSGILFLTGLTVAVATLAPRAMARLHGTADLGSLLMHLFFAVIGASANVAVVLRVGPGLFLFAAVILAVHLAVILLAGRLLKVDLAEVVIASNANMGGPTTAAAMAVARRWDALVIPAILCGTLGYAVATFVGVAVGRLLGP
jgi:uncharacterized membrane protein